MAKTVFGVFSERQNADAAVKDLIAADVPKGQIHLERITREDHGSIELTEEERQRFVDAVGEKATLLRVKVSDDQSSKVRATMMRQGGATFLRTWDDLRSEDGWTSNCSSPARLRSTSSKSIS